MTTEEEPPKPPLLNTSSQAFDYVELVQSASSLSTPPCPDQPFASEDLGETVIRLDKALSQAKKEGDGGSPSLQPPEVSPGPLIKDKPEDVSLVCASVCMNVTVLWSVLCVQVK